MHVWQNAKLLRKLREQAKFARWDEQTYYSLRESSERSHRALFRLVTEFRGILTTPCSPVFESLMTTGGLSEMQSDVELNKSVSLSLAAWSAPFSKAQVEKAKQRREDEGWFNMSGPSSILLEALKGHQKFIFVHRQQKKQRNSHCNY